MLATPYLGSPIALAAAADDPDAAEAPDLNLWVAAGFLLFAVVVVVVVALVYRELAAAKLDRPIVLTRVVALIAVVAAAVALAFSGAPSEALTAAFTLLGIVAGYLAGSKTPARVTEDITPGAEGGPATITRTESVS